MEIQDLLAVFDKLKDAMNIALGTLLSLLVGGISHRRELAKSRAERRTTMLLEAATKYDTLFQSFAKMCDLMIVLRTQAGQLLPDDQKRLWVEYEEARRKLREAMTDTTQAALKLGCIEEDNVRKSGEKLLGLVVESHGKIADLKQALETKAIYDTLGEAHTNFIGEVAKAFKRS